MHATMGHLKDQLVGSKSCQNGGIMVNNEISSDYKIIERILGYDKKCWVKFNPVFKEP